MHCSRPFSLQKRSEKKHEHRRRIRRVAHENDADTLMEVNEYLASDCTINQLSQAIERLGSYTYEGTISPAGEAVKGADYMEYYVDEQALQALVVDMFYELKK